MTKIDIASNALGTGKFTITTPNSNNNRTMTLPDTDGTILTTQSPVVLPRGIPLFSAFQSVQQAFGASSIAKVNLQSEEVDTNSWFDTSLSRYTPQIAGYYQFHGSFQVLSTATTVYVTLYKNGVIAKQGLNVATNVGGGQVSAIIYLNGSTDYVEMWASTGIAQNSLNLSYATYLQGYLVRAD